MTLTSWHAERLVAVLERPASSSGAVREAAYAELRALGYNVAALVQADRERQIAEHLDMLAQTEARRRLLADRVASGRLSPIEARRVASQIAGLDVRIKAQRQEANRVMRRVEARAVPPPSAPTPERLRHVGEAVLVADRDEDPITGETTPLAAPRYRVVWPIERWRGIILVEHYNTAARLRQAWSVRQASPKTVALDGAGGGHPGPRLPISDRQLRAGALWNAFWHRSGPCVREIILNFCCEEPPPGRERPLTAVEFGRAYAGVQQEHQARGVAMGAVKTALDAATSLLLEYDGWRAEQRRRGRRG
jgi:hypothetical protein